MVRNFLTASNLVIILLATAGAEQLLEDCLDVAIIGAGPSGTYAAWRLKDSGLKIRVFEFSDRIGGRAFTRRFTDAPDLNIELGAMRFSPNEERRTFKLAQDLGFNITEFIEGYGRPERTLYFLRNEHLYRWGLGYSTRTPYNLLPEEFLPPSDLRRYISTRFTDYIASTDPSDELEDEYLRLQSRTVDDDIPLFQQSAREVYEKTVSHEAFLYSRDTSGFHANINRAQATYNIPRSPPSNGSSGNNVKTIAEGMQELPVRLLNEFLRTDLNRHSIRRNEKLVKIRKSFGGRYHLTFRTTETTAGQTVDTDCTTNVCARKIIMAIPKEASKIVDWPGLKEQATRKIINSLQPYPVSKIFLLYPYQWWMQLTLPEFRRTHTKSDLPVRQTYDSGVSFNGRAALMISYTDNGDDVSFWRRLQERGVCASRVCDNNRVSKDVIQHAHIYLSKLYNVNASSIPPPIDGMMGLWDDYPSYAGWTIWKPGAYFVDDMLKIMKPSAKDDVFLLGTDFGTLKYHGSMEGGFHAADILLYRYFGIPRYV